MKISTKANSYLILALLSGALLPIMLGIAGSMNIFGFLVLAYALAIPTAYMLTVKSGSKETMLKYVKDKKKFLQIALIGLLNYAFLEFGLTFAERYISASLATVVYRSYPLLMLLFLPLLLREKVTKYQAAALVLAFAGLYFAITGGSAFSIGSDSAMIVFLIGIAMASAIATILVKKYMFNMESSMFIFSIANFILFLVAFIITGANFGKVSILDIISILYVGIVYNVFTSFMYYSSLRTLKTTIVTNFYFLSPFITFVFAYLLLGEAIKPYYISIAVLVAIGMVIQNFDKLGGTYLAKNKAKSANKAPIFDVSGAFAEAKDPLLKSVLDNGGRILATKVRSSEPYSTAEFINNALKGEGVIVLHDGIAQRSSFKNEYVFVKDVLGAESNDVIVLKAGKPDEGERFFDSLFSLDPIANHEKAINSIDRNAEQRLQEGQKRI
ncbi:MAG: DMT family transporter [Candidatus Micrarchaeia archaeon]